MRESIECGTIGTRTANVHTAQQQRFVQQKWISECVWHLNIDDRLSFSLILS